MEEQKKSYIKLSELVGDKFTISKVWGYKWKKWDDNEKKMLVSDTYEEGHSKRYNLETDRGELEVSSSQLSQMLEGVVQDGVANVNNRTFTVKSNGKTGQEIRYWINATKSEPVQSQDTVVTDVTDEPFDMSQIPF